MNSSNSKSLMQVTLLTVLTVHNPFFLDNRDSSFTFVFYNVSDSLSGYYCSSSRSEISSCTSWFGSASRASQDSSIGHKCCIARSKYDLPALSLHSGAKSLLHVRYFSSKFAYQTIKSGKKAFVLLISPFPPSNVALLL